MFTIAFEYSPPPHTHTQTQTQGPDTFAQIQCTPGARFNGNSIKVTFVITQRTTFATTSVNIQRLPVAGKIHKTTFLCQHSTFYNYTKHVTLPTNLLFLILFFSEETVRNIILFFLSKSEVSGSFTFNFKIIRIICFFQFMSLFISSLHISVRSIFPSVQFIYLYHCSIYRSFITIHLFISLFEQYFFQCISSIYIFNLLFLQYISSLHIIVQSIVSSVYFTSSYHWSIYPFFGIFHLFISLFNLSFLQYISSIHIFSLTFLQHISSLHIIVQYIFSSVYLTSSYCSIYASLHIIVRSIHFLISLFYISFLLYISFLHIIVQSIFSSVYFICSYHFSIYSSIHIIVRSIFASVYFIYSCLQSIFSSRQFTSVKTFSPFPFTLKFQR